MDYQDFAGPNGSTDNIGGLTNRIFYAPKSSFLVMQDVKAIDDVGATLAELTEITTPHTFNGTEGAFLLYCTLDKGSAEMVAQGDLDGRSFAGSLKGFTPGVDPALLGAFRKMKNDQFVVWPEMADGKLLQFGSPRFSAYILATKIGTATNSSGVRGTEWEVKFMESGPILYNAALTLAN